MDNKLYSVGDTVICHTFGSVKPFKAVIAQVDPLYFRDKNGTLITPADVVSFEHKPTLFKFGAYVTRWKEDKNGNTIGRPWTKEITFRLPLAAEPDWFDAVFDKAKETAGKRWKRCWQVTEVWMYSRRSLR